MCIRDRGSCADWDDWKYDVEKPQTIAQYEYLNDYAPLKEYLDRGAHPGFKVSAALGADEFNQQGPLFRLAAHNFDEIVAGNAMKMASCVNDQGVMDFSKVSSFVSAAEDAGLTVYGHTLAWHAQQPRKWLEKLIADKELDVDPGQKTFTELSRQTYQDGKFPFYQMGCAPDVINGSIHFVPTGDWSQFFCVSGAALTPGNYAVDVEIKSTKSGNIKMTVQNGWGGDAESCDGTVALKEGWTTARFKMTLEKGGNYDFILKPETFDATLDLKSVTIKKIVKTNSIPLTPKEKSDTLTWAMNKWISGMMQATGGKVKAWDLINEAISGGGNVNGFYALQTEATSEHNPQDFYWQDYFTPEMYGPIVEKAARDAYAAVEGTNPEDLKLFINDYNLESDWDDNKKVKSLVYWIGVWEKKGQELGWNTKIDGIGSQMHISYYENEQTLESKKKAIQNMLKIMAETGKLVRISEIDMGYVDKDGKDVTTAQLEKLPIEERVAKEKAMAEHYKWIIEQYFKIVPVSQQYGICQWCLTDSPTDSGWRPGQPVGLWNLNYQRKPAYGGFADGLANKQQ